MTLDMEKRRNYWGDTIGEWLSLMPNELERDLIGLIHIIPTGVRGFGLSGDDLEEFTRRALRAVLDRGAVPMQGFHNAKTQGWRREHGYGDTPDEIIENVVRIWLKPGAPLPGFEEIWFGMPDEEGEWPNE